MEKYFEILHRCPLFAGIKDAELTAMLGCLQAKVESFDRKYTVLAEGMPAKYIGILLSGSAQVVQMDYYGNRSIVSNVEPSQLFGEAFACAEADVMPVSVIANTPCEVMFIDCAHILHTCCNSCAFHQQMIFNLMKNLAQKNLQFHSKIEIVSKRTTREKLMTYLLQQAKLAESSRFDVPFDRQELADYLEVDRSGLSAEIGKLRAEGVLKSERKHFELL